jgi:hypothetical protein
MKPANTSTAQTASRQDSRYLLVFGVIVLVICILLPSPHIEGQDTGSLKHFGGGLFCGFLWLFLYRNAGLRLTPLVEFLSLYALVSMLGVAVELVELVGTRTHVLTGSTTDTSWDLLANTLGATTFWLLYRLPSKARTT